MSEKEYKLKTESMFAKNTVLINENEILDYELSESKNTLEKIRKQFESLLKDLLDRKILKSWYYNGNYSYEYSENYSNYNGWKGKAEQLEKELEKERKINEYIKARFVVCNTCTEIDKKKCLMFTEGFCEGERCEQIVDLEALLDKAVEEGVVR